MSRLDQELVSRGIVETRSQAENYVKLGYVSVDNKIVNKPGTSIRSEQKVKLIVKDQYVSRAGLKLASVAKTLGVNFKDKVVLDVGSSTGGFTDFAIQNGARKVIAVELGTKQMHPKLRGNDKVELHEKTDINDVKKLSDVPDIVVIDVSFVSLRNILPAVSKLSSPKTSVIAMVKPQFEAINIGQKHKGVIKNDRIRRDILKDFEQWVQNLFVISDKADSEVTGSKGNKERFYLLKKI